LHNYIYRRWFRPSRSEGERQRFICKFIALYKLLGSTTGLQSIVDTLVVANSALCAKVEAYRRRYDELLASGNNLAIDHEMSGDIDPRFHILQSLFQAQLIIVCSRQYDNEDSRNIGQLPVFVVRTGVEQGLSAPITFDPIAIESYGHGEGSGSVIQTSLETAIDFVIRLEAREAAAFGLRPDPAVAWRSDSYMSLWQELRPGEQLVGPSSKFVDTEIYSYWSGSGERMDSFIMAGMEQRELRQAARRISSTSEQAN
ncbi:hypothetical protein GQ53DRAFT_667606, partial [Thozetella sp. PMI_491]